MSLLTEILEKFREEVNGYLERSLASTNNSLPPLLQEAMQYGVMGGGKRLRAVLTILVSRTLGGKDGNAFPVAAAIEMIHCYSLIHDDLPAMDNDDYRRGQLSTHKKYGEAIGILTGDALLTHAFWLIAECTEDKDLVAPLVATVADAAGIGGMVSGQVVDILSENQAPTPELVDFIHNHKTGALIMASCKAGAIAARTDAENLQRLTEYGKKIGMAFQIVDDILDLCGSKEETGKTVGKDEARGKMTYPGVWGLARAKEDAQSLVEEACLSIAPIPTNERLLSLARFVLQRKN